MTDAPARSDFEGIDASEDAEARLRRSQSALALAMRGGRMGWWQRDLTTEEVTWSPELEELFGLAPGQFHGDRHSFLAFVHPDDRPAVNAAVAGAIESGGDYVVEFRFRHADGTWRWMEGRGRATYVDGRPDVLYGIGMDITERKQADELRDVFVGMLSHELRTPVTAIYGGSQVLRRDHVDEATRQEIIADIITESERLERLVENLLVLARAERHVSLGGRDPVLLRQILTAVVADKRRRWPEATIEVDIETGLPPVTSDDGSVELVVRNLISNALKYGRPDGTVSVTARRVGESVVVLVSDEGPGIDDAAAPHLFELFYRTEDAKRRAQGAGIGLFVVRVLVEAAGGRVWAANRPSGGAEFGFSLPVFAEVDDGPAVD